MPLGCEPAGLSLKIVEEEADTVRRIFDLYLEIKSIYAVRQAAKDLSLRTKARPRMGAKKYRQADARGTKGWPSAVIGPAPFGVTNIHYILTNSVYAGRIRHREQRQTGNHPAIIEPDVWDAVREKLAAFAVRSRAVSHIAKMSLLAGKLSDDSGDYFSGRATPRRRACASAITCPID